MKKIDSHLRYERRIMLAMTSPALTLRLAGAADAGALQRLARLDSSRALRGETLVAERDGRMVAAVSLLDGRSVADPFEPTADAVALLRVRARHLRPARRAGRVAFSRRLSPAGV